MADRVELIVELIGDKHALSSLRDIKDTMSYLNSNKAKLSIDTVNIKREINDTRREIDKLTSQKNQIKLDKQALRDVNAEIKDIEKAIENLRMKKILAKPDTTEWKALSAAIKELEDRLNRLYKQRDSLKIAKSSDITELDRQIVAAKEHLAELQRQASEKGLDIRTNNLALNELRALETEMERAQASARSLRETFASIGSGLSGAGSVLQNFGSIIGGSDVLNLMKRWGVYGLSRNIFGSFQSAMNRFDIMNTYADYMNIMGISNERAAKSLEQVNEAIQGLPIGLDEAAFQVRRYTMFLGANDKGAQKATDLVMGLNKALIAGGAPQQMRSYATYEIERLLATGELATARQWMSLLNGLGISTLFLKDALGRTEMPLEDFVKAVTSKEGEISGTQFLEGVMKLADNKELNKAIEIYKSTLESGMSNLKFAIVRGEEGILRALNDTFKATTGMSFSDYMYEGRGIINQVFTDMADWIRANPQALAKFHNTMQELYGAFKKFPWAKLARDVSNSIMALAKIFTGIYNFFPKGMIEKVLTFMLVWASPLGKFLTHLGGIFALISRFPPINMMMFTRVARGMEGLGGVVRKIGGLKTALKGVGAGFLGASAFLGIIAEMGLVILEFTKIAEVIAKAKLEGFWKNFGTVSGFTGIITGIVTAMVGIFSAISGMGAGAGFVVAGLGELLAAGFVGIMWEFGKAMKVLVSLANDIAQAQIPSTTKIRNLSTFFSELSGAASSIRISTTQNQLAKMEKALEIAKKLSKAIPDLNHIATTKLDVEKVKTNLQAIMGALKVLGDESRDAGFIKKWKSGNQLSVVQNIVSAVRAIDEARTSLYHLQKSKLFTAGEDGSTGLDKSIANAKTALTSIAQLTKSLVDEGLFKQFLEKRSTSNWNIILTNVQSALTSISGIFDTLINLKTGSLFKHEGFDIPPIMKKMRDIHLLMGVLGETFGGMENGGDASGNGQNIYSNFASNLSQLKEGIDNLSAIVDSLTAMKDKIAVLNKGIGLGRLMSNLRAVFAGEGTDTSGLTVNVNLFAFAMTRLMNALNTLAEVNLGDFIGQMQTSAESVSNLRKQFSGVGKQAKNAGEMITAMAETANSVDFSPLTAKMIVLSTTLGMAARSASNLASAINSIPTYKQVTVNYNRRNTTGLFGGLIGRLFHDGGSVEYLAGGGQPLRPRGTDTIPAMLTQGEYVMRRRAVTTFGQRFMENVNNLNIAGAMKELTTRIAPASGYIDNSRHYDNHATVNQTIHTNNPNYSYRRANRFVSAL